MGVRNPPRAGWAIFWDVGEWVCVGTAVWRDGTSRADAWRAARCTLERYDAHLRCTPRHARCGVSRGLVVGSRCAVRAPRGRVHPHGSRGRRDLYSYMMAELRPARGARGLLYSY